MKNEDNMSPKLYQGMSDGVNNINDDFFDFEKDEPYLTMYPPTEML